ncbi:MAG TPA: hypothetical protein VGL22_10270 [Terracidiphilus sp.]
MAKEKQDEAERREPSGFTPRSGGLTSEYAREQGWDLNEEQRVKTPTEKQEYDGGRDYDYGAEDFGDTAVDTSEAQPTGNELGTGKTKE